MKHPASGTRFAKHYTGYDSHVKHEDNGREKWGAHVYEFPSRQHLEDFLGEVGGAPHPYGGNRAIVQDENEQKAKGGLAHKRTDKPARKARAGACR